MHHVRTHHPIARLVGLAWILAATSACATWSQPLAVGPGLPTAQGEPRSGCERARWLDAVPSVMAPAGARASARTGGARGVAVFPRATPHASLSADQAAAAIDEPALAAPRLWRAHAAMARQGRADAMLVTGLLLGVAGTAPLALGSDQPSSRDTIIEVAGLAAAAVGLGLEIAGIVARPSAAESERALADVHLFRVDETETVRRGVERHNARVHVECADDGRVPSTLLLLAAATMGRRRRRAVTARGAA